MARTDIFVAGIPPLGNATPPLFMTHGYPNKRENAKTTLDPLRFPIVFESSNSAIYNF